MFSPEHQQVEICLLKSNLEEIENDLILQRSAIPALNAENEQKYRETMNTLRVARSLNKEIERLKQENVRLSAKRLQLQRRCEDVDKCVETARSERSQLGELLVQEERGIEQYIRRYEDTLHAIADRFRNSRVFYCEEEMKNELKINQNNLTELKVEEQRRQSEVRRLTSHLESLESDVPGDILTIIGKPELDEKLNSLTFQCDTLQSKYDYIVKSRANNINIF